MKQFIVLRCPIQQMILFELAQKLRTKNLQNFQRHANNLAIPPDQNLIGALIHTTPNQQILRFLGIYKNHAT